MGLYIKGIEMPEICDMCPLLAFIEEDEDHDAFCYCRLSNWKKSCTPDPMTIREVRRFRRLDCPLVEVKPHGRLIDADAFLQEFTPTKDDEDTGAKLLLAIFCQIVKDAPTILETEEDE